MLSRKSYVCMCKWIHVILGHSPISKYRRKWCILFLYVDAFFVKDNSWSCLSITIFYLVELKECFTGFLVTERKVAYRWEAANVTTLKKAPNLQKRLLCGSIPHMISIITSLLTINAMLISCPWVFSIFQFLKIQISTLIL